MAFLCFAEVFISQWLSKRQIDFRNIRLVATHVLLQGEEQTFGVLGGEDNAADHFGFGQAGEHLRKVEDKLRHGVCDNCKVGVLALCHLFIEVEFDVVLFCHRILCFRFAFFPLYRHKCIISKEVLHRICLKLITIFLTNIHQHPLYNKKEATGRLSNRNFSYICRCVLSLECAEIRLEIADEGRHTGL